MNIAKVSSRINMIMKDRNISISDLEERTGLQKDFLNSIKNEEVPTRPWDRF